MPASSSAQRTLRSRTSPCANGGTVLNALALIICLAPLTSVSPITSRAPRAPTSISRAIWRRASPWNEAAEARRQEVGAIRPEDGLAPGDRVGEAADRKPRPRLPLGGAVADADAAHLEHVVDQGGDVEPRVGARAANAERGRERRPERRCRRPLRQVPRIVDIAVALGDGLDRSHPRLVDDAADFERDDVGGREAPATTAELEPRVATPCISETKAGTGDRAAPEAEPGQRVAGLDPDRRLHPPAAAPRPAGDEFRPRRGRAD